ncbi:MAG: hypothetical protein ACXVHD_16895 [Solirubrobacteraceae bacterium]
MLKPSQTAQAGIDGWSATASRLNAANGLPGKQGLLVVDAEAAQP